MPEQHIMAFDAGGTAIKAALYDERGVERAAATIGMAPCIQLPAVSSAIPSDVGLRLRRRAQGSVLLWCRARPRSPPLA